MNVFHHVLKQKIAGGTGMTKLEWLGWTSNVLLRRIVDDAAISQFAELKRNGITINLGNYRRRGKAYFKYNNISQSY